MSFLKVKSVLIPVGGAVAHPTADTELDMKPFGTQGRLSPHPASEHTGCCHQYHDFSCRLVAASV